MSFIGFVCLLPYFLCVVCHPHYSQPQLLEPIDLGWEVNEATKIWPDSTGKNFSYIAKLEADIPTKDGNSFWIATKSFCIGEHGGTHIDAPYHFNKNGRKVADIPLKTLFPKAAIIDLSLETEKFGPKVALTVHDIKKWISDNGNFEANTLVLVRFGWSKYYRDNNAYLGYDSAGKKNFPGVTGEAAQWLALNPNIVGVGTDAASIDIGSKEDSNVAHVAITAQNKYIVEGANIPFGLPARGFNLIVMPMKTTDGTGAPLRLIAVPNSPIHEGQFWVNKK